MTKKQDAVALADELQSFVRGWQRGNFSGDTIFSIDKGGKRETELTVTLLEGAIAALRSQPVEEWLPIETCPPDGVFLLSDGIRRYIGFRDAVMSSYRFFSMERGEDVAHWPTHWQPLPSPPARGDSHDQ